MALINVPLETLDWFTASAVATNVSTEGTILSTDVVQPNVIAAPQSGSPQTTRPVIVEVDLNVTAGTGTTAVVIRLRQGVGVGGAQVGASLTHTLAAGASAQIRCKFRDTSGVPFAGPGTAYTVTIQQTGGTAAGTVNTADVEVKN